MENKLDFKIETMSMDDIVFNNRNKTYGAYQLRKNNFKNSMVALGIAFGIFSLPIFLFSFKPLHLEDGDSLGPEITIPNEPGFEKKPEKAVKERVQTKIKNANLPPIALAQIKDTTVVADTSANFKDGTIGLLEIENPVIALEGSSSIEKVDLHVPLYSDSYIVVDEPAVYPGGRKAMIAFIENNLEYPENAKNENIKGKVYLYFEVNKFGKISNAKVVKGIDKACDEEALRIVNSFPTWTPAKIKGQPVSQKHSLQLNFTLR